MRLRKNLRASKSFKLRAYKPYVQLGFKEFIITPRLQSSIKFLQRPKLSDNDVKVLQEFARRGF